MATKRAIDSFLATRRLAVVGVSRDPRDFTRAVYRALAERGYDPVPVNPNGGEIEGRPASLRVGDVAPPVEAALLFTPAPASAAVVRECAEAGVRRVWLHRGGGAGAVSDEALAACAERGLEVVDGECPMMFLPGASFLHRVHRFLRGLGGRYEA